MSSSRVALGLATLLALSVTVTSLPLWPAPASVVTKGSAIKLDYSNFTIWTDTGNSNLLDAVARYTKIIKDASAVTVGQAAPAGPEATLKSIVLYITGDNQHLDIATSYNYTIDGFKQVAPGVLTVTISAPSVFGAMYGLETFSQLVVPGGFMVSSMLITDYAQFPHRGLLIDSGRRFAPVGLLTSMIDALAYSKMNILHLHLSDWGGFRMEVAGLSELTAGLNGQYYTREDALFLVDYATKRGVRIIAEVDVPSHSGCFAPLIPRGLKFCDSLNMLLSPDNVTLNFVKQAVRTVMDYFPDHVIHLGGDETVPQGTCTWDDIHAFEREMQSYVQSVGRQPMVWNGVFSKPNATSEPNAAMAGAIIQNWLNSPSTTTTGAGFASVASPYKTMYLDQQCCAAGRAAMITGDRVRQCFYNDISAGLTADEVELMYGGEVCMWTDVYCPNTTCPNEGQFSWMFHPEADAAFTSSLLGLTWPRAAGAAGSLWNYQASVNTSSDAYADLIDEHNKRLVARGVNSCPVGCLCDWGHRCGIPYGEVPAFPMAVELTNTCKFHIRVKEATPCQGGAGAVLATIQPGESYTVHVDFLTEGGAPLAIGDPFGEWVGSGDWRDIRNKMNVSWSKDLPGYLAYTQTYPIKP